MSDLIKVFKAAGYAFSKFDFFAFWKILKTFCSGEKECHNLILEEYLETRQTLNFGIFQWKVQRLLKFQYHKQKGQNFSNFIEKCSFITNEIYEKNILEKLSPKKPPTIIIRE